MKRKVKNSNRLLKRARKNKRASITDAWIYEDGDIIDYTFYAEDIEFFVTLYPESDDRYGYALSCDLEPDGSYEDIVDISTGSVDKSAINIDDEYSVGDYFYNMIPSQYIQEYEDRLWAMYNDEEPYEAYASRKHRAKRTKRAKDLLCSDYLDTADGLFYCELYKDDDKISFKFQGEDVDNSWIAGSYYVDDFTNYGGDLYTDYGAGIKILGDTVRQMRLWVKDKMSELGMVTLAKRNKRAQEDLFSSDDLSLTYFGYEMLQQIIADTQQLIMEEANGRGEAATEDEIMNTLSAVMDDYFETVLASDFVEVDDKDLIKELMLDAIDMSTITEGIEYNFNKESKRRKKAVNDTGAIKTSRKKKAVQLTLEDFDQGYDEDSWEYMMSGGTMYEFDDGSYINLDGDGWEYCDSNGDLIAYYSAEPGDDIEDILDNLNDYLSKNASVLKSASSPTTYNDDLGSDVMLLDGSTSDSVSLWMGFDWTSDQAIYYVQEDSEWVYDSYDYNDAWNKYDALYGEYDGSF